MNKLEANLSLFIITFFAAVQNVFLVWIPDSVPHFAFLCITNLAGFLMTLSFFFGELFRLDFKQVKQSMVLALELIVFNIFMLLGVQGAGPTMADSLLSTDFAFVAIVTFFLYRQIADRATLFGVSLVFLGMFLMAEANISELLTWYVLSLLVSETVFACYIISISQYSPSSNPSIIAMGQMFFCFLFSLIMWPAEISLRGLPFAIPVNTEFWGSVIFVSFFIRALYGIVQIYVQRYLSPLNTSLIFSTEIVMALLLSPILTRLFGTAPERITPLRIAGSAAILLGVLVADPAFIQAVKSKGWALFDSLGSKRPKIAGTEGRRGRRHYSLYVALYAAILGACGLAIGDVPIALTYMTLGALAGIPMTILMEGVLHVGFLADSRADASFRVEAGAESLAGANDAMELAAMKRKTGMKRVIETQSCLEELSIRILNAQPSSAIDVRIQYDEAISMWLSWGGERYNPLYIGANEDEIDVAGLKIIKHRALQASFSRRGGENRLHIVI